jgi:error-prone DNA polymerase
MTSVNYIELHASSAFSFLEGAALPEDFVDRCVELGAPAIALLDRDGVYGAARFHMAAQKAGIRAHIGAELTMSDGLRLPVLVENRTGYQNLCRLITRMKLRAGKKGEGAAADQDLEEFSSGLIALVNLETAKRAIALFAHGNVYAELQRHFSREEEARNHAMIRMAGSLRIPVIATNGARYARPQQRELLDVFTCIHHHRCLEDAGRLLEANSERHLKSAAEMVRLFADLPDAVARTVELSDRLGFTLNDLGYQFPRYPVPEGETMPSFLRQLTDAGAQQRFRPYHERARRQIEHELRLIEKLDLAGYFLIVWDIVRFCREQGILSQGRGSAANSAVCYALGITAVDPIAMDLLFERFLSEERGEWPDIDLDLPSGDQRERVIQYVYERYGKHGAAMTANVITYRSRSAAREVGKVLGFEEETTAKLASLTQAWEWHDPNDTPQRQFQDAGLDLKSDPRIRKFFELFMAVQNMPRHLGQHSGGMVIAQGSLDSVVPLEPASMPGRVVVQWDKDDCADMHIVKVDLLGLGMMALLEEAIVLIRNSYHEEVDLAHLPADDPPVYQALQAADTVGMFQVESRAQMASLPRVHPERFYDIVVQVGIIRPGPIVGKLVHPYIQRRLGREPADCIHPSFEPVLKRTLGVPLFQEQLIKLAMIAAGFSGGEAEELRRAFSHKRSEMKMKEIEVRLRAGMNRNGFDEKAQDTIVKAIASFALYGFPESHAASFALIAYASAYIKTHYLAAFTAALLNNQPMGFYQPATIVKDAQRHGLRVRPVDVTCSEWFCTIGQASSFDALSEPPAVAGGSDPSTTVDGSDNKQNLHLRLGLCYVRGLRREAGEALLRARAQHVFDSVEDLAYRVPELRKDEMTHLAAVGALNWIGVGQASLPANREANFAWMAPAAVPSNSQPKAAGKDARSTNRRDALWQATRAIRRPGPLFEQLPAEEPACPLLPMSESERLVADFQGTGLTIGRHPMAFRREEMTQRGVLRAIDLASIRNGRRVRVAGNVIVRQRPGTAKGFLFLSLEDETGIANVIVTPKLYERFRTPLTGQPFLLVEGALQRQDGAISVKAIHVEALPVGAASSSRDFH